MGEVAYRQPFRRIAAGIVISLLLHVAALVFLRLPEPHHVTDPRTWLTQVEVRIVPPPSPPVVEPAPERAIAAEAPRQARRLEPRKKGFQGAA